MEIVIKIPDGYRPNNLVEEIDDFLTECFNGNSCKITTLPENHGDLIDVNRKITVPTYDEQYEEWGEKTMTVLEALNKWSDEGVKAEDVIIPGIAPDDEEEEEEEKALFL